MSSERYTHSVVTRTPSSFANDMRRYAFAKQFSDVTLTTRDAQDAMHDAAATAAATAATADDDENSTLDVHIHAHKVVLCESSPYFSTSLCCVCVTRLLTRTTTRAQRHCWQAVCVKQRNVSSHLAMMSVSMLCVSSCSSSYDRVIIR